MSGAAHFMVKRRLSLWWAVIGDEVLSFEPSDARKAFSDVCSRIVRLQERAGLPQFWIRILETTSGLHANVIFAATPSIACRLRSAFPDYMAKSEAIQAVTDARELVGGYLAKERTQQASWALGLPRRPGSYPLASGGDRVSLSPALKREAIAAGMVQPWQQTNATRKPPELDGRKRRWTRRATFPKSATPAPATGLDRVGQLPLPLELPKTSERLKDHRGGILTRLSAYELEGRRRRLGLSQRELGALAGISQPQIANIIAGRFGASRHAAARLLDALTAQERRAA